ncbi:MAG: hypothetical protein CL814_05600 [Confluentimicrobium sp.]|nr:hypothetical protein [Actibacterium sp.]|tara:strand:- start:1612 stop:2403 length:792 start_codon:yes stop_codon:yes gene_type:complete
MGYPHQTAAGIAASRAMKGPLSPARSDRRPPRATPLTRRYEVAGLTRSGALIDFTSVAPATPAFEEAFAAFARGTLIATADGPVAVEDLIPGTMIETADNGPMPLLWVGSMMIFPSLPDVAEDAVRLIRVTADSFGLARPAHDLVLGPRARVLFRHTGCKQMFGTRSAFAPARSYTDGVNMVSVRPAAPVRVYHLVLDGQQILLANGIEVESYHPGTPADVMVDLEMRELFLGLFPHVRNLSDFGPMHIPRLTEHEFEGMRAA